MPSEACANYYEAWLNFVLSSVHRLTNRRGPIVQPSYEPVGTISGAAGARRPQHGRLCLPPLLPKARLRLCFQHGLDWIQIGLGSWGVLTSPMATSGPVPLAVRHAVRTARERAERELPQFNMSFKFPTCFALRGSHFV